VELPDEVKKNISKLVAALTKSTAQVKWVTTKNLHITLKFLGWVEEKDLENIIELTRQSVADSGSFKAKFSGIGTFPEGKSPRVVWVGTEEGGGKLCELANRLEKNLSDAGFRSEEREFKPHLTIGRVKEKKGVDDLKIRISKVGNSKFGETIVDKVHIMKSTLTPKGPIYEIFKEVKL
jgi:2'-5' RNA ligase